MRHPTFPRVGFNAALFSLSHDHRAAGIHQYIEGLLTALAPLPEVRVVAFASDPGARRALPREIEVRPAGGSAKGPLRRIAWEQLALPVQLARSGAGLYHGAAYAMPAGATVPSVVTVHDLSFFRMPETLPAARAFYLRMATRVAARRASALIAVSSFTASELRDVLGVPPERIHVVHNGVAAEMRPASPSDVARYVAWQGLPERFILAVGTLQPRKNLTVLLDAYAIRRGSGDDLPPLVVVGAPGWGDTDVVAAARARGVGHRVHVAGFVPRSDLPLLYSAAAVFAYPSRYEGFGLPVLEAMACGTPVVAADAASLPEVAGSAAVLVDPTDAAAWAAALRGVLEDPKARTALVARGLERAKAMTWRHSALATARLYRSVAAAAYEQEGVGRSGDG